MFSLNLVNTIQNIQNRKFEQGLEIVCQIMAGTEHLRSTGICYKHCSVHFYEFIPISRPTGLQYATGSGN